MPSGFVQGSDEYRISQAIARTLREIDEAAAKPALMGWFRTQVHEAAQHVRRQAEVQARLQAREEAHARVILADTQAGGSKFTDKNRPPDRKGWIWDRAVLLLNAVGGPGDLVGPPSGASTEPDSASCPVESGAGEFEPTRRLLAQAQAARDSGGRSTKEARADLTVVGWFPQPSEEPLPEVWDTPAGSAALLALLHDRCLIDTTEPHNDRRIVVHAEELESLVASVLLFMAYLVDGNAEDEIARRWKLVEPKLPTAHDTGGTQPPDSSPVESDRGWHTPSGYVGTNTIVHAERFRKNGKKPSPSTLQRWRERAEREHKPVKLERDPASGELCYPESWVTEQIKRWNPRCP